MSKPNSNYWGLLFECPMNKETQGCSFDHIRKMALLDRIEYFNSLSTLEREELMKKHKKCLTGREGKVPFSRIAIM